MDKCFHSFLTDFPTPNTYNHLDCIKVAQQVYIVRGDLTLNSLHTILIYEQFSKGQ